MATIVYGANCADTRSALWMELMVLSTDNAIEGKPWIVLGDFNQTASPQEHSHPPFFNFDSKMRELNDCLVEAELEDLMYHGSSFTWWNKQKRSPIAKKPDRVLVNDLWGDTFSDSTAHFDNPDFSDHACASVSLDPHSARRKKPFRLYSYLLQNDDFVDLVTLKWFSLNVVGSAMFRESRKLKLLKKCIREFSKSNYSDLEKRVQEAHTIVLEKQNLMLSNPSVLNAETELDAILKWQELVAAEEAFLFQRARILWLQMGDACTAYFHRMVASRKAINHIQSLVDDAGITYETQEDIESHCVDYFTSILGGEQSPQQFIQEDLNLLFNFTCSTNQKEIFSKMFTRQEVRDAFFSLPKNKTSGPNGFSAEFFTSLWNVVGTEVTDAVLEFFTSGSLLKQWNSTTIVLIPKLVNATMVKQFLPICCLNTVYKVISKLLATRLKEVLPQIISQAQSAFLPGRLLAENVLMATDLVKGYNTNNDQPRAMLKVDLSKAFDSIRWDFILGTLRALSIPEIFINWISQCITTPTFTIAVNGVSSGHFSSSKGIRQGDPMSPYLFVLEMEAFSRLLQCRYDENIILYHPHTAQLKLTHLMFADDVMVFFDGSCNSLHRINECLYHFASWSGLHTNTAKTELFHSGLNVDEAEDLACFGFPIGSLPIRYLGLPLMSRKLKISEYEPLLIKLRLVFRSWAVKSLSFAGRLQLISSVINGIVTFWISTFILPKGCIRRIESLCSRFLWSGNTDIVGRAKIAWETVCLPKSEGGLGLRSFYRWNRVLCLRFLWLLLSDSKSLWVTWHKEFHLKGKSLWAVEENALDSWAWKQILKLRHEGIRFSTPILGNGNSISFWFDPWTPLGQLIKWIGPAQLCIPFHAKVSKSYTATGWSLPSPRSEPSVSFHIFLSTIPLPQQTDPKDSFDWCVDGKSINLGNKYPASKMWEVLRPRNEIQQWADLVWFKGATPKNAFNFWVANADRLPTRSRLASWGLQVPSTCTFCSTMEETRDHLFLCCSFSREVWNLTISRLAPISRFGSWAELLSWIRQSSTTAPSILRKLAAQSTIYNLWRQRNNIIHNKGLLPPATIHKLIDKEVRNSITARKHRKQFGNLMSLWLR